MAAAVPPPSHVDQEREAQGQYYPQILPDVDTRNNPQASQTQEEKQGAVGERKDYTTLEVMPPMQQTGIRQPWAPQFVTAPGPVMPSTYQPAQIIYQGSYGDWVNPYQGT